MTRRAQEIEGACRDNEASPLPSGEGQGEGVMKALARKLRKNSTDAERELWKHLRAHRMAGHKFRRQYVIEPYIVDFVCIEAKLIVEADGGQHLEQSDEDLARTAHLGSFGYKVLRFWNNDILTDTQAVLEKIHAYLNNTHSPNPLP